MARIVIAGDAHGRWATLFETVQQLGADILIQLGDTGFYPHPERADIKSKRHNLFEHEYLPYLTGERAIPIPTYIIKGNHEDFDFIAQLERDSPIPNLTYLPNGTVTQIHGTRFGVIGGNHSPSFYDRTTLHGGRRRHFTQSEIEQLAEQEYDVLLTHDAPMNEQLRGGCEPLRTLVENAQPTHCYHGHLHHAYTTKIGDTPIVGLAKVGSKQNFVEVFREH